MATKPSASYLLEQVETSLKREKDYRKQGKNVSEIYEEKDPARIPFNILYSNTETLAPALYNATPRPVVSRRFKDKDPLAGAAALFGKRTLEYLLDNGQDDYDTFDEVMKDTVLSALVPGRGIVRTQYKADVEYDEEENPASVKDEMVCAKTWPWNKFSMGYAQKWKQVPWVSYEHSMTKTDLEENFGKEMADLIEIKDNSDDEDKTKELDGEDKLSDAEAVTPVYEIWYKPTRKIYWVAKDFKEKVLREDEDPYDLVNFFDCPDQMKLFRRIKSLIPKTLYGFYEAQAKELNSLTLRLTDIAKQLKVRGVYDTSMGDELEKLFKEEMDGALVPVSNPALMQAQGGGDLGKFIWLVPIEKLVQTYVQLIQQRQAVKQTIYEITGISDILRGSSVASETATAQEIKNQWGTLRLKRMQRVVGIFARECLRIMLELAVTKMSEKTLKAMTGMPLPTAEEKQQAQAVLQQIQQQAAMAQQQAQMAQMQGMQVPPPQPPQIPPEVQAAANSPSIAELQALLADDKQRSFRVDIETNSTIDAEATEDKQDIAELLNAIAQFMNGVAPMIQQGVMPFEVAKEMLMVIVRRYNFGPELEASLDKMKQSQQPNPEETKKQQAELEKQKQALAAEQDKIKQMMADLDMQRKEFQMEQKMAQKEMALEAKYISKQQQMVMQDGIRQAEQKISASVDAAAMETEKMSMAAQETGKAVEGNKAAADAIGAVTQQFSELLGAMTKAMELMAKTASAPKQITDSKGRTMTVTPMTGE